MNDKEAPDGAKARGDDFWKVGRDDLTEAFPDGLPEENIPPTRLKKVSTGKSGPFLVEPQPDTQEPDISPEELTDTLNPGSTLMSVGRKIFGRKHKTEEKEVLQPPLFDDTQG